MSADKSENAAILFEPDGYVLSGAKLMGRQSAGNAFLRAAVAGLKGQPLWVYTPHRQSAEVCRQVVRELDAHAEVRWTRADRLDVLAQLGTLYMPGPGLSDAARLRLHAETDAYSIVGVTHTTASHRAMDAIAGLLSAPVMPWDALICTSAAVADTVRTVLSAETEALRWRFGTGINITLPQLPVIPLGVHCSDFQFSATERADARRKLDILEDDIVALFVGRLSFHAKAHPHAMYVGVQSAAERTRKKVVLLQCGWFANPAIEKSFADGATQFCPGIRALFTDGREADERRRSWAAADLFISLSDNIQETFGLTPIEAMAAGLPALVSDWNGYKGTVRDGVDGFRIRTWMPPSEMGEALARSHEAGLDNYDVYCGLTCQTISVDMQMLVDRLSDLLASQPLRQQLGAAARGRARDLFDWAVVFRQYQLLWSRLGEIRRAGRNDPSQHASLRAPFKVAPSRMDPFRSFGHYATASISHRTLVAMMPGASQTAYERLAGHELFGYARRIMPTPTLVDTVLGVLAEGPTSVERLAHRAGSDLRTSVLAVSVLAKLGLVRLDASSDVA